MRRHGTCSARAASLIAALAARFSKASTTSMLPLNNSPALPFLLIIQLFYCFLILLLARKPPAKKGSKSGVQEPEVETQNDSTTGNCRPCGDRFIHQGPHKISSARKHHQRNDWQREHEAEDDLTDDQGLRGIEAQHDNQHSRDHRHQTPYPDRNGKAHKALHNNLSSHRSNCRTGE